MKKDLKEFALKIAQAARAGVVIEKAQLKKILEERQKEKVADNHPQPHEKTKLILSN